VYLSQKTTKYREINNTRKLFAPLNWDLGHATIPIIKALQRKQSYTMSGIALAMLRKSSTNNRLPSYQIEYAKMGISNGSYYKMLQNAETIFEKKN
jgi:hypothetical protein